jgi:group I intron endonuclease
MAFIYRITNLVNGKKYVGETALKDPLKRWKSHLHSIREGRGCPLLKKAVEKHGVENFKFEVICECSHEERYDKEKEFIASENSLVPHGYNVLKGGPCGGFVGKKHSEETIAKMSEATKRIMGEMSAERKKEIYSSEKRKRTGFKMSESAKRKLSEQRKGQKSSDETKKKVSEGLKKYHTSSETREQAEETRRKMSEAAKKRKERGLTLEYTDQMKKKHSDIMSRVRGIQVDKFTREGVFVESYTTLQKAAEDNKTTSKQIKKVMAGSAEFAGGFTWKQPANPAV